MLEALPRDVTLLIIEHDMDVVFSLADRITVLHYGEVLAEGTFAEVKADPRVHEVYLGQRVSMLDVEDIHTYYGDSHVLHGVSLRWRPGEAVALLGRNGAGKTTPIRSIVGFTPPRAGRVVLRGTSRSSAGPPTASRGAGIALVPQGRRIFAPLTVRENLLLGARGRRAGRSSASSSSSRACASARGQSGGHAVGRRAADARHRPRAAHQRPPAPARRAVGGPGPADRARDRPHPARAQGASGCRILLVEQNYHLALRVADRVYVMNKGQIVYEGTPAGLEADEEVKRRVPRGGVSAPSPLFSRGGLDMTPSTPHPDLLGGHLRGVRGGGRGGGGSG